MADDDTRRVPADRTRDERPAPPPEPIPPPAPEPIPSPEPIPAPPEVVHEQPLAEQEPPPVVQAPAPTEPEAAASVPAPSAAVSIPAPPVVSVSNPQTSSGARMREVMQARKRERLEEVLKLAAQKRIITNNDVEKLLKVSDATATRYLSQLVKEGRLKYSGAQKRPRYEPI